MTTPMPDADLADLRNMLERSTQFNGEIIGDHVDSGGSVTPLGSVDIDDVRALVARLDAAEKRRGELAKVFGHQISTELNTHFRAAGITPEEATLADVFARRLREVDPDLVEAIRAEVIAKCASEAMGWLAADDPIGSVAEWIEERVKP